MAQVTGRGSSPRALQPGQKCDNAATGCPNLASTTVLVERDDFGSEYADLCDGCGKRMREERAAQRRRPTSYYS